MTFAPQGGGTGNSSRYIRDHNLQYVFTAADELVRKKRAAGASEEAAVKDALAEVQQMVKANALKLQRTTLIEKMKKLMIERPKPSKSEPGTELTS